MRWLQWARIDLERGLGGVEVHARCLARELRKQGVDAKLSSRVEDLLESDWDVIHTHGSSELPRQVRSRLRERNKRPVFVHTLHGTTLGRMAACGEWAWPGGYLAYAREARSVARADVVLSVHPELHLYRLAGTLGKPSAVCGNGWDAGEADEALPAELEARLDAAPLFWVYIGRGEDRVKGADILKQALRLMPDVMLAAVSGTGFEEELAKADARVIATGALSSGQVRTVLKRSRGLILPSRYEGLPLVVLEALSQGVPVVATRVGGLSTLPSGLAGLFFAETTDPRSIADAVRGTGGTSFDESSRNSRMESNRRILPRWSEVAGSAKQILDQVLKRS